MKIRLTEKSAILIAAGLGFVVLLLMYKLWAPLVWGNDGTAQVAENASGEGIVPEEAHGGAEAGAEDGSKKSQKDPNKKNGIGESGKIIDESGMTLEDRVLVPAGYVRTPAADRSMALYLRGFPLKKAGKKVKLYNGEWKEDEDVYAAVFKLPIEKDNLQQCGDSVLRVYAEYFWSKKLYDRISFRLADGFQAKYETWRDGYRIQQGSERAYWSNETVPYDDSYANFKKFLRMVFAYTSLTSLQSECVQIKKKKIQSGDIFLQNGNPGHAVMVVDVCENGKGQKAYLLAQGSVPAQQFHLLNNPGHREDPWYYENEIKFPFETPEFTFEKGSLYHPLYNDAGSDGIHE